MTATTNEHFYVVSTPQLSWLPRFSRLCRLFKNNIKANKGQWKYELQTAAIWAGTTRSREKSGSGEWKTQDSDENLGDSWAVEQLLLLFRLLFLLLLPLGRPSHWHGPTSSSHISAGPPRPRLHLHFHLTSVWLTGDSAFDVWQSTLARKPQGKCQGAGKFRRW